MVVPNDDNLWTLDTLFRLLKRIFRLSEWQESQFSTWQLQSFHVCSVKERIMNELILYVLVLLSRGYLETKWNKNWRGNKSQLFAVSVNVYKYHCYFAEVLKRLDLDRNLTYFALSTRFPNRSLFHSNPLLQMLDKTAGSVYSTLICMCRTQKLQIWYYIWEQNDYLYKSHRITVTELV